MLHTHIFGRNHLAIEQDILRLILLVLLFDQPENGLHKTQVIGIVADFDSHKLGSLNQTVDANRQVLPPHIDVAGIEQGQHSMFVQRFQILVIGQLRPVAQVDDIGQKRFVIELMIDGILHTAVDVHRQHALRTGRYATRSQSVAETVVLYLVAQAATAGQ